MNTSDQVFKIIKIKTQSGSEVTLLSRSIDGIASQFGAVKEPPNPGNLIGVSPEIVFDRGDVYMTGWQTSTFDVSAYRGMIITLSLEAGDVGDSIFDTAILLDEISVQ